MDEKNAVEEKVLYKSHPSMFRNHPMWFVTVFVLPLAGLALAVYLGWHNHFWSGFAAIGIPLLISLVTYLAWWIEIKGTTLTITNHRSKLRRGLLSKRISEVWHQDVRNVQLDQSLLQRILGVGKIAISSAADAGKEIEVNGMPDPERIKSIIDRYRVRSDDD